jgi:predicted aspartyl protease
LGTFFHAFTLIATSGATETLEALVDTGSTFSTVPRTILERLGVTAFARVRLRLADGRLAERDIGEVRAEIDGLPGRNIICIFGEPEAPVTMGAQALETFLLGVDPDQKRLVPLEAWWA